MSNTYSVVFLLCYSSSCVLYFTSFSGLSFFGCQFGILEYLFHVIFITECDQPMACGQGKYHGLMFYYNKNTDTCEKFRFKGSGGNDNMFYDYWDCEEECRKEPTSPSGTVYLIQRSLITNFSFRYSIYYTEVSYYQLLLPVQYILYRGLLLPNSPSGTVALIQRYLFGDQSLNSSIGTREIIQWKKHALHRLQETKNN